MHNKIHLKGERKGTLAVATVRARRTEAFYLYPLLGLTALLTSEAAAGPLSQTKKGNSIISTAPGTTQLSQSILTLPLQVTSILKMGEASKKGIKYD